ncbi:hypothetical protein FA15DRAFT_756685 [Coprinopsis marcescibilis]|uniref:F-box domain-containing protein n=1 Tax=Coprinopsis marcescibilis TaxID=230819 RepID=A0A5C3KV67_COPMA|nr:hypothetical protein FA15DRAFT_756685 [Coprinopsis marcescibilis]
MNIFSLDRLPNETLSEIFAHCIPTCAKDSRPTPTNAPLQLSQVSSQWRAVTRRTPHLWTSLNISRGHKLRGQTDFRNPTIRTPSQLVDRLQSVIDESTFHAQRWIDLSQSLPLRLWIEFPAVPMHEAKFRHAEEVVSDMWREFLRWIIRGQQERICFLHVDDQLSSALDGVIDSSSVFPILRTLSLDIQGGKLDDFRRHGSLKMFPLLENASLDLHSKIMTQTGPLVFARLLPLQNLTRLSILSSYRWTFLVKILERCTSLVELMAEVADVEHGQLGLAGVPMVVLPHLKSLDLLFRDREEAGLLAHLHCPSLETLAMRRFNGVDWSNRLVFEHQLPFDCSLSQLHSLTLSQGSTTSAAQLVACLASTVNLVKLELESNPVDYDFLFHRLATDSAIVPRLRLFSLGLRLRPLERMRAGGKFTWSQFKSMIETRYDLNPNNAANVSGWIVHAYLSIHHPYAERATKGELGTSVWDEAGRYTGPLGRVSDILTVEGDEVSSGVWKLPYPLWVSEM